MTEAEEIAYIHGLLPRLKDQPGSILLAEDLLKAGFPSSDVRIIIERLEDERLAKRTFSTSMQLTTLGLQVARAPDGYQQHLRRLRRQATVKEIRDWLGAYGSLIGGIAGVGGSIIAGLAWLDSRKTASEQDRLQLQLRQIEQVQLTTEGRLARLEQVVAPASSPAPTTTKPAHLALPQAAAKQRLPQHPRQAGKPRPQ
jgi:hypothetical protein